MTEVWLPAYRHLFIHRPDVFAQQQESGVYLPIREPITDDDLAEHLAGLASYGTYVIDPTDHTVRYIVWDLDTHDEGALSHLTTCIENMLRRAVQGDVDEYERALQGLLLESSGNKGTHAWLFLSEPVAAAKVRRWVARDFTPAWLEGNHGPIEVFPKQDAVVEGGFGNLVKLPFGKHAVSGRFSEVITQLGWAGAVEDVQPLNVDLIPEVAPDEVPATRERALVRSGTNPQSPFACINALMATGIGEGRRQMGMFHLALYLFGHGVPEDLAQEMCERANENFDPPMKPGEVRNTVQSAYTGKYAGSSCKTDWLREFCPGPCDYASAHGRKPPENALKGAGEGTLVEVQVLRKTHDDGRVRLTLAHPDAANTPTLICE